ncbi:RIO kinase 2 [Brevipalpus obovatus]|uniref:RIO kinase 2 n=1 Tax=Brevipalpus obovatus TaxID=246614 RepID=UPI003D9E8026
MVKLDAAQLRYLSSDDIRVLIAVEMGMKNHQLVPGSLVSSIAALKGGGASKILHDLTRKKLLIYERGKRYDGYRLTYLGYDYLALNVLSKREAITSIGNQIGVGKESDVYIAVNSDEERYAVKLHRLGRTCFRKVHEKRDYHKGNNKVHNWIYLSRLAAIREFSFLKALHERGLPVPKPIDANRHCIVMELIEGTLLNHFAELEDPATLFDNLMNLILSLANDYGVVHGDFNEFNIMLESETLKPMLIDFPQMISVTHSQAREYFQRDVNCIVTFFKRFDYHPVSFPDFDNDVVIDGIDVRNNSKSSKIIAPGDIPSSLDIENDANNEHLDNYLGKTMNSDSKMLAELKSKAFLPEVDESNANRESSDENSSVAGGEYNSSSNGEGEAIDLPSHKNSNQTYSVAGSTFTTQEIRTKVKKELASKTKREETKRALKGIKGEDCAVRRQRRINRDRIKDDANLDATFC